MNIIFLTGTAGSGRSWWAKTAKNHFQGPVVVIEPREQFEAETGIASAKTQKVNTLLIVPNTGNTAGDAQLVLDLSTKIGPLSGNLF